MTTLYKTVKIETVEQAEALPVGSVAELRDEDGWHDVAVKFGHDDWRTAHADSVMGWLDSYVVDWTAFAPIEAEEEWGVEFCEDGDPDDTHVARAVSRENAEWRLSRWTPDGPGWARIVQRTAATPWEAQS